jgi:hypothetical protein
MTTRPPRQRRVAASLSAAKAASFRFANLSIIWDFGDPPEDRRTV